MMIEIGTEKAQMNQSLAICSSMNASLYSQPCSYTFHKTYSYRPDGKSIHFSIAELPLLEVLLLLEELRKANNRGVDEESSNNGHEHGRHRDAGAMCE